MINKPFYSIHQILTGQYTSGEEFINHAGINYIGGYHVLPNGQIFSEFVPNDSSYELFKKISNFSPDVSRYNFIRNIKVNKYIMPEYKRPFPTMDDYNQGYIYRFFVQKRNNPLNTILEIDFEQFQGINTRNQRGINGIIWNHVSLKWRINGSNAAELNKNEIIIAEREVNFKNLQGYLLNLQEFYR